MSEEIAADIKNRVVEDYGEESADEIFESLLARIPPGLPNGTRPRHLRCILYLARGDRYRLEKYINVCLQDTRDVMLGAEYETEGGNLVRKRDFSLPFDKAELSSG